MNFIIAQILGFVVIIICSIIPQFKRREWVLLWATIANLLYLVMYYLLGQKSGIAICIVMTVRTLVFFLFARKDKEAPFWIMLLFVLIAITSTIMTWDSWICIFVLISAINTYGQWQKDLKIYRIALIITTLSLGIYNILVMAYTGVINEFLQTISASIALWRYRNKEMI